jgi:hypothetical protein
VREDLLALLEIVDTQCQLKYSLMGNFLAAAIEETIAIFNTGVDIPNLGVANADSPAACVSFLVWEGDVPVNLRRAGSSGERISVDQLSNPDSVEFRPGGLWHGSVVIQGPIATESPSPPSQGLMKRFWTGRPSVRVIQKSSPPTSGQRLLRCCGKAIA